jgi:hypothetical protein
MTTVPLTGAPGFRFYKDLYPSNRAGGMSYYPYSSIINGLTPSINISAAAPAATVANVTVAVSAGRAYLDGQIASLASSANVVFTPVSGVEGILRYDVYLNPTRMLRPIALGAAAPTTLLNGAAVQEGDMYAECIDYGEYFGAKDFFLRTGTTWTKFDPTFAKAAIPAQSGKNRSWGAENRPQLGAGNLTVNQLEKRVFIETLYPPYTSSMSKALLHDTASLYLGSVDLFVHVLPKPVTATLTNGNTAVTIAAADRPLVADIVASIPNTNTLVIDGAAVATAGYNAGTGVLTLAASFAGTSGTRLVNITPSVGANVNIVSPARSSVDLSENFTNP